ncbi:hypothetical protein AFI02nite_06140 [Aliivibrio fischeri]|uniref:DUF1240 domain-containing protein n=1 Tax=Aliivibrio fischeri TaxID=668 RepID=A0A510UDB1_ALIFS|nr:hypothetical protein AFI02nite_06140 [Aliivibrio fischeri]
MPSRFLTLNKDKKQLIIGLLSGIFIYYWLFLLCYWLIEPLVTPYDEIEKVVFSFDGLVYVGMFSTLGFFIDALFNINKTVKEVLTGSPKTAKKHRWKLAVIFAVIGFGFNYANYFFVIKPNHMIECPSKAGYKNNLLTGYVKTIDQCEQLN